MYQTGSLGITFKGHNTRAAVNARKADKVDARCTIAAYTSNTTVLPYNKDREGADLPNFLTGGPSDAPILARPYSYAGIRLYHSCPT